VGSYLRDTLECDKVQTQEEPSSRSIGRLRPAVIPPTLETAKTLFHNLFFNPPSATTVQGRPPEAELQVLQARREKPTLEVQVLTKRDIPGDRAPSHRGEERPWLRRRTSTTSATAACVRSGELMENQYRIGLVRMERAIKERHEHEPGARDAHAHDLITPSLSSAVVKEYFGSSQLSQFMDQTNPLARSPTSVACRPSGRRHDARGAQVSRCATFTPRTTAVSARSRRLKVRTSA